MERDSSTRAPDRAPGRCRLGMLLPGMLPLWLAGCGGGVEGPGGSVAADALPREAEIVLLAPVDRGARLTVQGVELDAGAAQVLDAEGRPIAAKDLGEGMTVAVEARLRDGEAPGAARRVRVGGPLQGPLERLGDGRLAVLGTAVRTDASTRMEGAAGPEDLRPGDPVRIWGLRGADGTLTATRVEKHALPFAELRLSGPIANLNPGARTFILGGLVVTYAGAAVQGTLVEAAEVTVRGDRPPSAGQWAATSVTVEPAASLADDVVAGIEGFVTAFRSVADFRVAGVPVDASRAAIGAAPGALREGVRVTVRGVWRAGRVEAASVGLIDADRPRTILNLGPIVGTPFWWGPSFWGPGWLPWVGPTAFLGSTIVTAPGGPSWLGAALPPRPPGALWPGQGTGGILVPGTPGVGAMPPGSSPGFGMLPGGAPAAGGSAPGGFAPGGPAFGSGPLSGPSFGAAAFPGPGIGDSPGYGQPTFGRPGGRPSGGFRGGLGGGRGGRR